MASSAADRALPSIAFRASAAASASDLARWRNVLAPLFHVRVAEGRPFAGSLRAWLVENLVFVEVETDPVGMEPALPHAGPTGPRRALAIWWTMPAGGVPAGAGPVALGDASTMRASPSSPFRMRLLLSGFDAFGLEPHAMDGRPAVALGGTEGVLLAAFIDRAFQQLNDASLRDAPGLAAAAIGIASGVVGRSIRAETRRTARSIARRAHILAFIESRLSDPGLSVATICERFGIGRATLFRDFGDGGGIERVITERRLHHALHDLVSARPTRGRVAATAARWGFSSPVVFNRAFRRRYGFSPGNALGVGPGVADEPPPQSDAPEEAKILRSWLGKL